MICFSARLGGELARVNLWRHFAGNISWQWTIKAVVIISIKVQRLWTSAFQLSLISALKLVLLLAWKARFSQLQSDMFVCVNFPRREVHMLLSRFPQIWEIGALASRWSVFGCASKRVFFSYPTVVGCLLLFTLLAFGGTHHPAPR